MSRKPRICFSGAIYHVISRGNYRKDLFHDPGSGEAFERSLFEAAESCNWLLHGFMVMSNHYHAVIETPEANLSKGMQWLQGTFANRFNRFRGEYGHVFQGRFKSPLVERGEPLRRVVDYVHLNPVRAGLLSVEDLRNYRPGSYSWFWNEPLPPRLVRAGFLEPLNLPDSLDGMRAYEKWLKTRADVGAEEEEKLREELEDCWILGSEDYRRSVQEKFDGDERSLSGGGAEVRKWKETKWEKLIREELRILKKKEHDIPASPKLADWKIAISRRLRAETSAGNGWIAKRLHMGHPSNVSRYQRCMPKSKV
ncbi:MAG: transposase [Verrucomicrobia bacterium]|jgi:REP element-mobilizing transposase RayT|nr:transposase [Verrucomicrobiota bacterium]